MKGAAQNARRPRRRPRVRRGVGHVFGEAVSLYWGTGISDDIPALAWYLLVSLVPLALGLTALATVALQDEAKAEALIGRASSVLPKDVHAELVQLLLRTHRDSPLLIAGALAVMLWVGSGAVGVLERVLRRLLEGYRPVTFTLLMALRGKARQLARAGVVSVLILLLVAAASVGTGLVQELNLDAALSRTLVPLLALAASVACCALLYRGCAPKQLGWRAAFAGALVGGPMVLAVPTAAGYYVRLVAERTPVGVFLVLAGIVFTCNLVATGLLLGAAVSARVRLGGAGHAPSAGAAVSDERAAASNDSTCAPQPSSPT